MKGKGNQGPVTYCVKISTEAKRDGAKTAKDPLQPWYGGHSCFYTKNREKNVFFSFFPKCTCNYGMLNIKIYATMKVQIHSEGAMGERRGQVEVRW